jgi:hypothetical protein
LSAADEVEASVPLWVCLSVADEEGTYWPRLDPGRVVVSVVQCAEVSAAVWFAAWLVFSALGRARRWVAGAGPVIYTDTFAVPSFSAFRSDRGVQYSMSKVWTRDEDKKGSIRIKFRVFPGGECTFGVWGCYSTG